jgi:ribosomal protein L3
MRNTMRVAGMATVFTAGLVTGMIFRPSAVVQAQGARVFELRTYTAPDGKLDALQTRFRDHTRRIFDKHGMTSIGYWVPEDEPLKSNTLIYILAHPSREAAKKNWADFAADPEWKQVSAESQKDGPIVSKVVSVFMDAADYSAIK